MQTVFVMETVCVVETVKTVSVVKTVCRVEAVKAVFIVKTVCVVEAVQTLSELPPKNGVTPKLPSEVAQCLYCAPDIDQLDRLRTSAGGRMLADGITTATV